MNLIAVYLLFVFSNCFAGYSSIDTDTLRQKVLISEMVARDQAVRWELLHYQKEHLSSSHEPPAFLLNYLLEVDHQNSILLRKFIHQWGWPDKKQFGEKYSQAIWLLMQHADQHIDLQLLGLKYLQKLAATDSSERKHAAYLWDRVQMNKHLKQRYGTQGRCVARHHWQPFPMENMTTVDDSRKSVGLDSLDSYKTLMNQFCY